MASAASATPTATDTYGHEAIAKVVGSTLAPLAAGTDALAPPRAWAMQRQVRNLSFSAHCAPQVSAHLCCAMERAVHVEHFQDHERVKSMLFEGALASPSASMTPGNSASPDPTDFVFFLAYRN